MIPNIDIIFFVNKVARFLPLFFPSVWGLLNFGAFWLCPLLGRRGDERIREEHFLFFAQLSLVPPLSICSNKPCRRSFLSSWHVTKLLWGKAGPVPSSLCCNSLFSLEFVVACMYRILHPAPSTQDVGPNKTFLSEESLYHNTSSLHLGEMRGDFFFCYVFSFQVEGKSW